MVKGDLLVIAKWGQKSKFSIQSLLIFGEKGSSLLLGGGRCSGLDLLWDHYIWEEEGNLISSPHIAAAVTGVKGCSLMLSSWCNSWLYTRPPLKSPQPGGGGKPHYHWCGWKSRLPTSTGDGEGSRDGRPSSPLPVSFSDTTLEEGRDGALPSGPGSPLSLCWWGQVGL